MSDTRRSGEIQAKPTPKDPATLQVTYETKNGRMVLDIPNHSKCVSELEPHGAESFHDPEQHQRLMDRVEAMLKEQ